MNKVEDHSIRYGINLLELMKMLRLRQIVIKYIVIRFHAVQCTVVNAL